jgi:hypothetical protein
MPRLGISEQDALRLIDSRSADGRRVHPLMDRYCERHGIDLSRLGASYFDEPESRLAVLGPPAITRLMLELWRTDRWVIGRFDLRNPLHRRDYSLWLSEGGPSLGLDQQSIAAALAIVGRGTSLVRVPPRWPSEAARGITPPDASPDAWLAEPIGWDHGSQFGGIPMPRALALLWELRRDVRLHFTNRTEADMLHYIAWCLTQGARDRCVAVELTEPALTRFLDMPDPEFARDDATGEPPLTRLLQIMAPLYDGPFPEVAREFPRSRRARLSVAIWVCGALRRRFGWPKGFVDRPLRWLSSLTSPIRAL